MNRIALFLCLFGCAYLHAQSTQKEDGIPYRPIAMPNITSPFFGNIPAVMPGMSTAPGLILTTPSTPPVAWKIEYPNGFKGDIIITIPDTDTAKVKSHFIYRSGHRRTRLIIKRK